MQDRAKQTQQKILKAARALFAKSGFHGTRVDAIATRARVNKERIYAYFGSKEGLFGEVLRDAYVSIVREEEALQSLGESDIPSLPRGLVDHYMKFHGDHPHFWRLVAWENLEGGRHAASLKGLREPAFAHLRSLYQRGQEQDIYKATVSFETFMFVISAVCFFYFSNQQTMSQTLGIDLKDEGIRDRIVTEVMRALTFRTTG